MGVGFYEEMGSMGDGGKQGSRQYGRYGVRFGIYGHRFGAMARRGNIYWSGGIYGADERLQWKREEIL